jgi:phenylpropionate dioxygenase-like ring-hydroxylating dioxygenase large terminal subunit
MGNHIGSQPLTKKHTSDAHIPDDWYIVCRSAELRRQPRAVMLLGVPIVLFRDASGKVAALLDRCPHRNVPLSLGMLRGDLLQCAYHGWSFDSAGMCRGIPGFSSNPEGKGRRVQWYPARESDGFVWVYATPDATPVRDPYAFPFVSDRRYMTIREEFLVSGSVHAVAENALDVPHTAFLHGGLFRRKGGSGNEIEVTLRLLPDRAEAEYRGEPRPSGIAGLLLAPRGGTVKHTDRFVLPSIAQVEYRLGETTHFCVSSFLTPVQDQMTRLFAVVSLRLPFPPKLIAPVVRPLFMSIFQQDARMLRHQAETIDRFGGEQFCSTEIDLLGPAILRLLRLAERGERDSTQGEKVHTVRMII